MFIRQFCRLATAADTVSANDQHAIEETFVATRAALADHDAERVVESLSTTTRAQLEAIREAAVTKQSSGLPPAEKFAALGLRRFVPPRDLTRLDSAGLVGYALGHAWLGPNIIRESGLKDIAVTGDRAEATLLIKGRPQVLPADFVRENGVWKIDLTRVVQISDQLLKLRIGGSGRGEEAVIAEILDNLARKENRTAP